MRRVCDGCHSGRMPIFDIEYDCMKVCWICKIRMNLPHWLLRRLDGGNSTER